MPLHPMIISSVNDYNSSEQLYIFLLQEVVGTLLGFDDFVNMVLEDVVEYESTR